MPEVTPRPKSRKAFGPYRVRNIGVDGDVWEVVEMQDNASGHYTPLRPRKVYLKNRQPAYGYCKRLNKQWQVGNATNEELLEYWKAATN